jgi:hypothetical protein
LYTDHKKDKLTNMEYNEQAVIEYLSQFAINSFPTKKAVYEHLQEKLPELGYSLRQWRRRQEESSELNLAISEVVKKTVTHMSGLTVEIQANEIDEEKLYAEMVSHFDKVDERANLAKSNTFEIDTNGPVAFVLASDQHLGGGKGTATDIKGMFTEAELVNSIDNCWFLHNGDLSNNFIGNWTTSISHNRRFTIEEEAAISRKYMNLIKDRLIAFVSGNHNAWSEAYSGLDVNLNMLNEIKSNCFYDNDELFLSIKTPYFNHCGVVLRHIWNGFSQFNPTHAIERNAKNMSYDAKIWAGAHIHSSSLIREFNIRGETNYAFLTNTYKRYDDYSKRRGFSESNKTTAIGWVLHPEFGIVPFSNLYALRSFMESEG